MERAGLAWSRMGIELRTDSEHKLINLDIKVLYWHLWFHKKSLKGSYGVAKMNIILCICCNAMCLCDLRLKHFFFHILYIIVALLCSAFLKCDDFYKVHLSEKRGVLWLASYLVRWIPQAWDGSVTPLTVLWCRVPAQRHKNNKTHNKWGICCIQWGHNYWL